MPGAQIQVASNMRSSVDAILSGDPDISFWRTQIKRPTMFALESIPVAFNSTADFGTKTSVTIPQPGDLIHSLWLQITVPDLSLFTPAGGGVTLPTTANNVTYCNSVGLAIPQTVELDFAGAPVDVITSEWLDVSSELTLSDEKRQGFNSMVGRFDNFDNTDPARSISKQTTFFVPFDFYFQGLSVNAIPICAMPYTQVTVNFQFRSFLGCIKSSTSSVISMVDSAGNPPSFSAECFCEQVYLTPEEKARFLSRPLEYPVTTHQLQEEQVLKVTRSAIQSGSLTRRLALNFTGPVKTIIWTYVTSARGSINSLTGNDWFNYSMPAPYTNNPFDSMTLFFGGSARQSPRMGEWYRKVTTLEKFPRMPPNHKMIMTYPFCTDPMDNCQPSGSANFTRISNPYATFVMNQNIDNGTIRMWAPSWQVLRVYQNYGSLVYQSNA